MRSGLSCASCPQPVRLVVKDRGQIPAFGAALQRRRSFAEARSGGRGLYRVRAGLLRVCLRERRHQPWCPPGPEKTGCGPAGCAGFAGPRTDCRLPAGHQTVGLAGPVDLAGPVGPAGPGSAGLARPAAGPVDPGCSALAATASLADPVADVLAGPADLAGFEIVGSAVLAGPVVLGDSAAPPDPARTGPVGFAEGFEPAVPGCLLGRLIRVFGASIRAYPPGLSYEPEPPPSSVLVLVCLSSFPQPAAV